MSNKENLPTTPTSKGDSFSLHSATPTPMHKSPLKPISPNKQKTGKLTFLESDNLDEHFNLLHTTQEEIQQQLYNIELNSKQTHVDLEQLFDRSKNNNEHLHKLLSSVVTYSQEVMTEGNATKADMNKIIQRLDKLNEGQAASSKVGLDDESINEIRRVVKDAGSRGAASTQLDSIKEEIAKLKEILSTDNALMSSQLTKQDTKQAELKEYLEEQGKKSGDETRSLVSSTLKVETNTEDIKSSISKLEKSVQALEEKLPPTDIIHQITAPIIAELQAVTLDAKTVQLLESISETTKKSTQKDPTLDLILQKLDGLGKAQPSATQEHLEEKYNKLEAKYAELCKSYTAKFDDYKRLQKSYQELQEQIESTQIPTTNRESKMENLNNFHKLKVGQIEKSDFISERKRIASTPMVKLRNTNFSNNSDEE